jgi:hypothetical protein
MENKMKKLISLLVVSLFVSSFIYAQESKVVESEFKVSGNCGQCKTRIEKAMKIKEVKFARWDKTTKMLKVAYLSPGTTIDSLMHRAAIVGHDTEKFKADNAVYAKLPSCCLYRDGNNTH